MVEQTIKKRGYFKSRNQLFIILPKQVMPETLNTILKYLQESNKINLNKDGSIIWTFSGSPKIKKRLKKSK
jgi:hypothetical protein